MDTASQQIQWKTRGNQNAPWSTRDMFHSSSHTEIGIFFYFF